MTTDKVTNQEIATLLEEVATLLERQNANPFRVRAYHTGAASVRAAQDSLADRAEKEGTKALEALPGIGEGLAATIAEYVRTRRSRVLERLQGEFAPTDLFVTVPGIGQELAERIVDQLGIETLEALERAAHDGRLAKVKGFGTRRIEAVRASLGSMLSQSTRQRSRRRVNAASKSSTAPVDQPTIALLLDIDAEYQHRAAADDLNKIAPRRFNPTEEAWLPVMHTERDGWEFTVLFSNTARAHELHMTDDWVVIYYRPDGKGQDAEGQNTVVTETRGPLIGKRSVRGREDECEDYYANHASKQATSAEA